MPRILVLPLCGRYKFICFMSRSTRQEDFVLSRSVFRMFLLLFENEKKNPSIKRFLVLFSLQCLVFL